MKKVDGQGQAEPAGWTLRSLNAIERVANRLPDPVTLFILSIMTVMALSALLAAAGVSITVPNEGGPKTIAVVSLLEPAMLRRLFVDLPSGPARFRVTLAFLTGSA